MPSPFPGMDPFIEGQVRKVSIPAHRCFRRYVGGPVEAALRRSN